MNLDGANLRGACLAGADLLAALTLNSADLSGCDLSGARLHRIVAREGGWLADLTDAYLIGADPDHVRRLRRPCIDRADFTGANLFRADLGEVRGRPRALSTPSSRRPAS